MRLLGIDYRKLKDAPKDWRGNSFRNFKQKSESWMYEFKFKQKVGRD